MSWFVMNQLGLGPVTAVCATILTCTLLGVVIEKIAYTPLRSAPPYLSAHHGHRRVVLPRVHG